MSACLMQMSFILLRIQQTHRVASSIAFVISGGTKVFFQENKKKLITFHCYKFPFQGSRQLETSKTSMGQPRGFLSIIRPTEAIPRKSLHNLLK